MHRQTTTLGQAADTALEAAQLSTASREAITPEPIAWGTCPNCSRLLSTQATDCPHCGAIVGPAAAWHVREVPGLMPTPTEAGALAAAARRRAARAAAMEASRRSRPKPIMAASLGQQLLDTAYRLELSSTDTATESEASLFWGLLVTVLLAVPAGFIGGMLAVLVGGGLAVLLLFALGSREEGFRRTVVMDVTHAALTVDICWPRLHKTHHRHVPARDLRLCVDRCEQGCEGSIDITWRVTLVLPQDADDPGDARITLAVDDSEGHAAATALCGRLASHLGVAADAPRLSIGR